MNLVRCEVDEGPREGFKAVSVKSVEGHREHFSIEERFLTHRGDGAYLPAAVIGRDPRYDTVLVELWMEADSGARRVWVRGDQLEAAWDS